MKRSVAYDTKNSKLVYYDKIEENWLWLKGKLVGPKNRFITGIVNINKIIL